MIHIVITNEHDYPLVHVESRKYESVQAALGRALRLKHIGEILLSCKPHSVKILKVFGDSKNQ
jgi:hypothetical protein